MKTVKAVCNCKNFNENDLVIAVKEKPAERWGCLLWSINSFLVLITWGSWFTVLGGYYIFGYFLLPTYLCQFCNSEIEKNQFRITE